MNVAVVGAGIGGLATALALAARGHAVTLVERRTGFSEVGAGLQLSPNAARVLIGLGLGPALARAAGEPPRVAIRALRSGAPIGAVALGPAMRERYGAPYWVIHRAALQTILLDAVRGRAGARLLLGREVAGVEEGGAGATLSLAGRGETIAADVVVAADGVRSVLRARVGDRAPLRATGAFAWRATLPIGAEPAGGLPATSGSAEILPQGISPAETGLWLGPGRHVVHYPIEAGRRLNVVAICAVPAEGGDEWGRPGDPGLLRAGFADATPVLADLLARPDRWLVWPLVDRPVAGSMARGRVALVGDAAHPIPPFLAQGAALAIEDAAVLAVCLEGADAVAGLSRYANLRAGRAERVRREARRNGRVYHAGRLVGAARDLVMRRLGARGMSERYAWLYGWAPPEA